MSERAKVFLALPSYGQDAPEAKMMAVWCSDGRHTVAIRCGTSSILPDTFNQLWCEALNTREKEGWTHFAMAHSDVRADTYWLDKLIAEQREVGADVLAAVIAIKDELNQARGATSTALIHKATNVHRRLTLSDIHKEFSSPTFEAPTGFVLCMNTGLWCCDFTKPWVGEVDENDITKVSFRFVNFIKRDRGIYKPRNFPEDWNFSLDCEKLGVKVFCTRKLVVEHCGRKWYTNQLPEAQNAAEAARQVA